MTELSELPLRADLVGKSPYGAPMLQVPVRLNTNENTHSVPETVVDDIMRHIRESLREINRYPDRDFDALRAAFARYLGHGVTPQQVWAANGSNEVLQQVLQAFGGPGRSLLGFPPTYAMYPMYADGTSTTWVTGTRGPEFRIEPATVVRAIEQHHPDIVVLCAPNNPTGTPVPLETIVAAYDATDGMVIVDEAYAEFMPKDAQSALTLLPGRPRLIVSRTMSKAFAFAGARVGYLVADPAVVDALRLVRLPYHLSSITQAAAIGALAHAPEMLEMVDDICRQRDRMAAGIEALGLRVWPSWTNFLLFDGLPHPHETWQGLLDRGILVRDLSIPGALRVSAGTAAETDAFLEALAEVTAAPSVGSPV